MGSLRSLNLLLPVYKGGDLLLGAIDSIENSNIAFDNIFLSFNGEDQTDYFNFIKYREAGKLKKQYTVFRTYKDLSALLHGDFVLSSLKERLDNRSMLMLLAHDDRILPMNISKKNHHLINDIKLDTVYFPSYSFCDTDNYNLIKRVVQKRCTYTVKEFFFLTMNSNIYTNVSGIILPFSSYESSVLWGMRFRTGARGEHMFCVGPKIKFIRFDTNVSVLIGERPDSDGQLLSRISHRAGSLAYVVSYAANGHLVRSGGYLKYVIELLKKSAAYLIEKI